jgi:cytochrome c-type protein NapB
MSNIKKGTMLAAGIAVFLILSWPAVILGLKVAGAVTSEQIIYNEEGPGIRKIPLYDEKTVKPIHGEYSKESPGKSKKIERAFDNSPPMIPHKTEGMLPMTVQYKMTWFFTVMCVGCHMPEDAKSIKATPIPQSHFMDFRTGEVLRDELDRKRTFCIQCHVPQTDAKLPVENLFEGQFRDERGKNRSNLVDTLNEGVVID